MRKYTCYIDTPVGPMEIAGDDDFVSTVNFVAELQEESPHLPKVIRDCTDFQRKVWAGLCEIPFGTTTSYLQLSKKLGDVKAIRAVGTANGKNNIAIIVPCHRVIGSNGNLVGYAGGLDKKKWLLEHEARMSGQQVLDL